LRRVEERLTHAGGGGTPQPEQPESARAQVVAVLLGIRRADLLLLSS